MFTKKDTLSFRPLLNGITMRPLAWEEKTLLCEFKLEKGAQIPPHNHPYEQTGYLVSEFRKKTTSTCKIVFKEILPLPLDSERQF